jgi:hypothetical protein
MAALPAPDVSSKIDTEIIGRSGLAHILRSKINCQTYLLRRSNIMANVTDYWTPMEVDQFIPNVLMTPLDSFLLTRIFESERYEDGVYFSAEEWPGELIFLFDDEPDHLREAIEKTKDIDPELCADVKRAMQTDGDTVEVNCYTFGNYCRVFQGIIRRSSGKLPYVTTQGAFTCTKMRPDGLLGGMAEVITADAVESVSTFTWARDKLVELGLEKAE